MNTSNPIDLFYEIDCPFDLLAMTSFELGLLYMEVWE